MENTDHISSDFPTVDTLEAIRRNHAQRLLDMAESLLQGFEAMDIPKDAVGLDRMGKALLTLNKVMDTLHKHARELAHKASVERTDNEMTGKSEAELEAEPAVDDQAVKPYRAAQALRLEAIAVKRAETGQTDLMRLKSQKPRRYGP